MPLSPVLNLRFCLLTSSRFAWMFTFLIRKCSMKLKHIQLFKGISNNLNLTSIHYLAGAIEFAIPETVSTALQWVALELIQGFQPDVTLQSVERSHDLPFTTSTAHRQLWTPGHLSPYALIRGRPTTGWACHGFMWSLTQSPSALATAEGDLLMTHQVTNQ